jgi:hypothetical protein
MQDLHDYCTSNLVSIIVMSLLCGNGFLCGALEDEIDISLLDGYKGSER